MRTNKSIVVLLVSVILVSCLPVASVTPTETIIPKPVSTLTPMSATNTPPTQPLATSTNFALPFNDKNIDHEYCQLQAVQLSIIEAQDLSEDEIAAKLVELMLAYFFGAQVPGYCRVDGYRIDKVYYDERTPYLGLRPIGDFLRRVEFSIKLIQVPNMWMSWAGEIDQQNWLHTGNYVAVFRAADGYTMKFANP